MKLETAIKYINNLIKTKVDRNLSAPEILLLKGTWKGLTYEEMAEQSEYSLNYLMRDIAPKLWKLLSKSLGTNVGKTNIRNVLEQLSDEDNLSLLDSASTYSVSKPKKKSLLPNFQEKLIETPTLPLIFYDRSVELQTLKQWIVEDKCRLVGLWGAHGIGKTALAQKLAQSLQENFEYVIWHSLSPALSLKELVDSIYRLFSQKPQEDLVSSMISLMKDHSLFLVIDGVDSILKPRSLAGKYREEYQDYEKLFQYVGVSSHQSAILLTGLEKPQGILQVKGQNSLVRSWQLSGLFSQEIRPLLSSENLSATTEWQQLIDIYQGNPRYLQIVAKTIAKLFNGNVAEFLAQKSLVFGEIAQLLDYSFNRLSDIEQEILYWLASEAKAISLSQIQEEIPLSIYPGELIEALESLQQRSLIETTVLKGHSLFILPPIIQEYVTNQFIAQISGTFSVQTRQKNQLLGKNVAISTISLGKKPTRLSQWLDNQFETGWQPLETLLINSGEISLRLRSAFNLRGKATVKRFKQIKLGKQNDSPKVILLVAIEQEQTQTFKICVQAQPIKQEKTLPPQIKLSLLNTENETLAEVVAEKEDNFIQLPYFSGELTENFKIELSLDAASHIEEFVI